MDSHHFLYIPGELSFVRDSMFIIIPQKSDLSNEISCHFYSCK